MNKWVVLVLMVLAFAAGGLSFYKMGQRGTQTAELSSSPSPTPATDTESAVPSSETSPVALAPTGERPKSPNFGVPPRPGSASSKDSESRAVRGEIKAVIFSASIDGAARTSFPKSSESIYMTVTPEAMSDKVELEASFRSALKEEDAFSQPVQSSGPPRRRTFRLAAPEGGWVSGPYQVIIKPSGSEQELSYQRFEIEKEGAEAPANFNPPEYLSLVRSLSVEESGSSVFYADDPQVYLRVASYEVPQTSRVRSVWSAVEVDKLTSGELVSVSEVQAPGPDQDALFTFTAPKGGFLSGSYRVDIYFDQQQVGTQAFFIQPVEEVATATPTP